MDLSNLSTLPEAVKRLIFAHAVNASDPTPTKAACKVSSGCVASRKVASSERPALPELSTLKEGLAIVDGFLALEQVKAVRACAEEALQEQHRKACMGGSLVRWKDDQARGDLARWLHADEERQAGRIALAELLDVMQDLQEHLEKKGYDVGGRATFQLALYPGHSTRYVRHADRSRSAPNRRVTAICYLNPHWEPQHGGQLAVYTHSKPGALEHTGWLAGEPATVIAPLAGRLVVFDSSTDHEVLPAQAPRWAVTAWFHCVPPCTTPTAAVTTATATDSTNPSTVTLSASTAKHTHARKAIASAQTVFTSTNPTTSSAALVSSPKAAIPRIFVSIAAYRDSECQWTVKDLLQKATHPDRVRVGICWQVDPTQDASFVRIAGTGPIPGSIQQVHQEHHTAACSASVATVNNPRLKQHWLHQVREVRLPSSEATGPCKARSLAAALWDGEEYYLQIDSHMRFVDGWDEACIDQLARAESLIPSTGKGAVLTTYPADYGGSGAEAMVPPCTQPVLLCPSGMDGEGMMRTRGRMLAKGWEEVVKGMGCMQGAVAAAGTHAGVQAQNGPGKIAMEQIDVVMGTNSTGQVVNNDKAAHGHGTRTCMGVAFESRDCIKDVTSAAWVPSERMGSSGNGVHEQGHGMQQIWSAAELHGWIMSRRCMGDPLPCAGWAAGFSFSRADLLVRDAAYPPPRTLPHLFFGEEMYQFARMWTHGYECFSPAVPICYHQWQRSARTHKLLKPLTASTTSSSPSIVSLPVIITPAVCNSSTPDSRPAMDYTQQLRKASQQKVLAVLGVRPWPPSIDACNHADRSGCVGGGAELPVGWGVGEVWGLGSMRSMQEWQERCGVNLMEGTIKEEACWNWLPRTAFEDQS